MIPYQKESEYEAMCKSTAIYPTDIEEEYLILGLVGEVGEIAQKLKKAYRDGLDPDNDLEYQMAQELGDVLWYLTRLANYYDYSLEDIMIMNSNKLISRVNRDQIKGSGDNR